MASPIDPRLQFGSLPTPSVTQNPGRSSSHGTNTTTPTTATHPPARSPASTLPTPTSLQQNNSPRQPYYTLPPINPGRGSVSEVPDTSPGRTSDDYHDHAGSDGEHASGNNDPNVDPKRSRACEACRGLKVRCDQDPNQPEQPCKRCAKAGRKCIITAPTRKRQKKTDSRVAELEKKIDALTATLQAQDRVPDFRGGYTRREQSPEPGWKRKRRFSDIEKGFGDDRPQGLPDRPQYASAIHAHVDHRMDQIINMPLASRLFDRYVKEMSIHMPVVAFDSMTTAADVRAAKPILFCAIIEVASVGVAEMIVQEELNATLRDAFADLIIRNGHKSLEVVQALLIHTLWYRPPKRYDQMNFYQLIHMAAIMSIDMGMGKRYNPAKSWRLSVAASERMRQMRKPALNSDSCEARRTWLGCYFLCSQTSMTLRRAQLVRWNNYMEECVDILETSADAFPSDKILCQHVRLQHVNEEVGAHFFMDDPSASVNITDSRVQYQIKAFERQHKEWRDRAGPLAAPTLKFLGHNTSLYIHEVAMHINHNIDDFRAPFTEDSLRSTSTQDAALTPGHSISLSECLTSVHSMFSTFVALGEETIRNLPIFYMVRMAYATIIMIKLHFAVTAKDSEIGKLISKDDLRAEEYLDQMLDIFRTISANDNLRPANKFVHVLGKLREWFTKNKDSVAAPVPDKPQPATYTVGDNPLHFLSEVATTNAPPSASNPCPPSASPQPNNTSQPPNWNHLMGSSNAAKGGWFSVGTAPMHSPSSVDLVASNNNVASNGYNGNNNNPMMNTGTFQDTLFDGMDLSLGMGDADLSSLLMGDASFTVEGFGLPTDLYYPASYGPGVATGGGSGGGGGGGGGGEAQGVSQGFGAGRGTATSLWYERGG